MPANHLVKRLLIEAEVRTISPPNNLHRLLAGRITFVLDHLAAAECVERGLARAVDAEAFDDAVAQAAGDGAEGVVEADDSGGKVVRRIA